MELEELTAFHGKASADEAFVNVGEAGAGFSCLKAKYEKGRGENWRAVLNFPFGRIFWSLGSPLFFLSLLLFVFSRTLSISLGRH